MVSLRLLTTLRVVELFRAVWVSAQVTAISLLGPLAVAAWSNDAHPAVQLLAAAFAGLGCWIAAVLLLRHALADECRLAGRKAMALLFK